MFPALPKMIRKAIFDSRGEHFINLTRECPQSRVGDGAEAER